MKDKYIEKYYSLLDKFFENNFEEIEEELSVSYNEKIAKMLIDKMYDIAIKNKDRSEPLLENWIEMKNRFDKEGLTDSFKKDFFRLVFKYDTLAFQSYLIDFCIKTPFSFAFLNKCFLALSFTYFLSVYSSELFIQKSKENNRQNDNLKLINEMLKLDLKESKRLNKRDLGALFDISMLAKVAAARIGLDQKNFDEIEDIGIFSQKKKIDEEMKN